MPKHSCGITTLANGEGVNIANERTTLARAATCAEGLRIVRRRSGASLRAVAGAVGVHYSHLSRLERGLVGTSLDVLGLMATFYGYGYSPSRLLGAAERLMRGRGRRDRRSRRR